MSDTIASLELEVSSNAQGASSGLDALTQSLGRLKTATSGGAGLTSVANSLKKISDATKGLGDVSGLTKVISALSKLKGLKVSSTIGNGIKNIGEAVKGLQGVDLSAIGKIAQSLTPLSEVSAKGFTSAVSNLKKLPEIFSALKNVNMGDFANKMREVANAMKPLADEMAKISSGFASFPSKLQKVTTASTKLATSNQALGTSYINLWAKFRMAYNTVRWIGTAIGKSIKSINTYIENVNLFTASMGTFAEEAKGYAEEVADIMGIDPSDWLRNQGVFMTLATGFGVVGERAYTMSKNLTQLGYDLSSFFNLDIEDAMIKVQSGLAGELEPLRRLGFDLSQTKLQAIALEQGITKSVSSMTQAEKAELRYLAIMTQVTTAHGDMARTLDAPANQMRILQAQFTQLTRAIGSIFIPILNKLLPYLIAGTKVLREMVSAVAALVGFTMPEVDYSGITNGASSATDALDEATESAKKLKDYTMGFDELNVINPSSGGDDSSLGGTGFNFNLPEYDFLENVTATRIDDIVKKIKEWLGITGEIKTWSDLLNTRLGEILIVVGEIGAGIALWKVTKGFLDSITLLKTLLSSPTYAITIGATIAIVGLTVAFTGMADAIKEGLDGFNFAEIIGGGLLGTGGAALLGSKIVEWIGMAFSSPAVSFALANMGMNLGVGTTGALGAAIGAAFVGIIAGIPTFFVGIYDACVNGLDWLSGLLIPAGATAAGAGIGAVIGMLGGPIGAGVGALIGLAVGAITDLVILIVQNWDAIAKFFVDMWDSVCSFLAPVGAWFNTYVIQPVVGFFKGLWTSVSGFFKNLWNDIVGIWNKVCTWFDTYIIQPLISFFEGLVLRIGQFFEGCWILIQAVWVVASTWFDETVIQPLVEFFKGVWEKVSKFFSDLWEDIKAIWKKVSSWFDTYVIQPVVGFFNSVWTKVSGFFTNLWEDIKTVWNKVSSWFNDNIIEPVKTAFDKACEAIGNFFSSLWLSIRQGVAKAMNGVIGAIEGAINWVVRGINSLILGFNDLVQWGADVIGVEWGGVSLVKEVQLTRITVPTYADGGYDIPPGQMFIAREAGAEMVGSIGRKTAVANNDQIVSGIANGVAEANGEQNALLREQNTLLRALLEKEGNVYLDGRKVTETVDRHHRERGRAILVGGAY